MAAARWYPVRRGRCFALDGNERDVARRRGTSSGPEKENKKEKRGRKRDRELEEEEEQEKNERERKRE